MVNESHLKSFLKALSWRVFATTITFVASYVVTGNLMFATAIGLSEMILKIALYYLHERLWQLDLFNKN